MLDPEEFDWFEEVSDAHKVELQRFRRAIRRAGDQFGFYVFIARPTLHDALLRQIVQAGLDELQCVIATEWIEDDDLRASVEALLQRRGAMYEGLALPGDALVAHSNGALVAALNLGRERLAEVVRGPFVLCVSEHAYAQLPDLASDLWSARSGTFTFDASSRIRTTQAIGTIAMMIDGTMYVARRSMIERWRDQASVAAASPLEPRSLSRWSERIAFVHRNNWLDQHWIRPLRLFAAQAVALDDAAVSFCFLHAELFCRELAGQAIRSREQSYSAIARRLPRRHHRAFALAHGALMIAEDSAGFVNLVREIERERDSMAALQVLIETCLASLDVFGGSEELLGFIEQSLLPQVVPRKLWMVSIAEVACFNAELRLGRIVAAAARLRRLLELSRRLHDELMTAMLLRPFSSVQSTTTRRDGVVRECLSLCRKHGLHALEAQVAELST